MKIDKALQKRLIAINKNYEVTVPVFRIRQQGLKELMKETISLAKKFAEDHGLSAARYSVVQKDKKHIILLPEGAQVKLYPLSGAVIASRGWPPFHNIISPDAEKIDYSQFADKAQKVIERLSLIREDKNEDLRFERLWKLKASGITRDGMQGNVALTRVVSASRRYLAGLPVWGRASVFVQLAAKNQVDSFGIDWRRVHDDPFDKAFTIDPAEGAKKVLEELQTMLPDKTLTLEEFEPEFFSMGYFSLPKNRAQTVMQPTWVARLKARGMTSTSHLIVVPATSTPYEPICRISESPLTEEMRRE